MKFNYFGKYKTQIVKFDKFSEGINCCIHVDLISGCRQTETQELDCNTTLLFCMGCLYSIQSLALFTLGTNTELILSLCRHPYWLKKTNKHQAAYSVSTNGVTVKPFLLEKYLEL